MKGHESGDLVGPDGLLAYEEISSALVLGVVGLVGLVATVAAMRWVLLRNLGHDLQKAWAPEHWKD